jgi:regulator of RNase E activity RraB
MTRKLLFLMALPFGALAAQQPSNQTGQQPPVTIKAEKAEYRSQAKITSEAAVQTALARVPRGQIREGELEKEHGRLVYSFDVIVPNREGVDEVQVDAQSGKVVSVKHESAAAEAKEHGKQHEDAEDNDHGDHQESGEHESGAKAQPKSQY